MAVEEGIHYEELHIYPVCREVYVNEKKVILTTMEFDVLYFLASNPNRAFTKNQIYEAVSKNYDSDSDYVIRDIIYRLRNKLQITYIQTLYGYGYKFGS